METPELNESRAGPAVEIGIIGRERLGGDLLSRILHCRLFFWKIWCYADRDARRRLDSPGRGRRCGIHVSVLDSSMSTSILDGSASTQLDPIVFSMPEQSRVVRSSVVCNNHQSNAAHTTSTASALDWLSQVALGEESSAWMHKSRGYGWNEMLCRVSHPFLGALAIYGFRG